MRAPLGAPGLLILLGAVSACAPVAPVLLAAEHAPMAAASCGDDMTVPPPRGVTWAERSAELHQRACFHRYGDSVAWRLGPSGLELREGAVKSDRRVDHRLRLIEPVWQRYGGLIATAARAHAVPAELILTVIVEESGGKPSAIARYRGYRSDAATPRKISVGLGQMLISTARATAPEHARRIDRRWLSDPANAISLIARFLADQYRETGFDPPLAAASYNVGAIMRSFARDNRWRLLNANYVESSSRADRPDQSFATIFAGRPPLTSELN